MNKKMVVKNALGKVVYCVLSSEEDYEEQLKEVFGIVPGQGFTIEIWGKEIRYIDYFHGETRAKFDILSMEDTELPVELNWKNI